MKLQSPHLTDYLKATPVVDADHPAIVAQAAELIDDDAGKTQILYARRSGPVTANVVQMRADHGEVGDKGDEVVDIHSVGAGHETQVLRA